MVLIECEFGCVVVCSQNTAWFDQQQSGQLQNRLVEDLEKVRLGVSDKIALSVQNLASFVSGISIGTIIKHWTYTINMHTKA